MPEEIPAGVADLPWNLHEAELFLVRRALNETAGNVAKAAALLGVSRMRIYRVMARQDAMRPEPWPRNE